MVEQNASHWHRMVPLAVMAYNSGYNRTIRDSPYFLLFLRDPQMPYEVIQNPTLKYNLEDLSSMYAMMATRVFERCQDFLDSASTENENRRAQCSKIKPLLIGDRVYIKNIPKGGVARKLQPLYSGPYRVVDRISDVVIKLRSALLSRRYSMSYR